MIDLTNIVQDELKKYRKANRRGTPKELKIDVNIFLTLASDKGVLDVTAKVGRKLVGETKSSMWPIRLGRVVISLQSDE